MAQHTYKLRQQFNAKYGRFSEIAFIVDHNAEKPFSRIIHFADPHTRWELACRAGIEIFFDYYDIRGEIFISILSVSWLPVDTTNMSVIYAMVKGLAEALNVAIPSLKIDEKAESFIFPVRRK